MTDPKTTPAFARPNGTLADSQSGMTQYAYVAMTFHAALLGRGGFTIDGATLSAFSNADAFFAELAKRTKS